VKLDLKAVLGAGPPTDAPAAIAPPQAKAAAKPSDDGPSFLPPRPSATSPADSEPARPNPKPVRSGSAAKPNSRERVAVNVPGDLLDFVRSQAANEGDYLTDVVLEALARHGQAVVQRSKDRVALRARPPRRSARQRGVKHPTLLVLYLSTTERSELDEAANSAFMTRSAFVAELLRLDGVDEN
jgi:uncharacterized protein (DUF1778 family)